MRTLQLGEEEYPFGLDDGEPKVCTTQEQVDKIFKRGKKK